MVMDAATQRHEYRRGNAPVTSIDGYKHTELGLVPADWNVVRLGDVGQCLIGLTYSPRDIRDDGILVLRSSNIQHGKLSFEDNVFVDTAVPNKIMVQNDDVLICVRNGSRDLIGKSTLLDERCSGMTFGAFMSVFRSELNKYIHHIFNSSLLQRQIREHLGATINQITNKSLNSFVIPIPNSAEEQVAISQALDDIDAMVDGLDRLITKKRYLKKGLMLELLSGRRRLPGFKGDWESKELRQVCTKIQDGTHFSPTLGGTDFLYVTSKNVSNGYLDLSSVDTISAEEHKKIYARCDTRKGDILLTKDGASTGNAAINTIDEPVSLLSSVAMLRVNEENCAEFILQKILSDEGQFQIKSMMSGNAITRLTLAKIKSLRFTVPKREEQIAIANILSDMDQCIDDLGRQLVKASNIKQGMIQELLTGGIRLI